MKTTFQFKNYYVLFLCNTNAKTSPEFYYKFTNRALNFILVIYLYNDIICFLFLGNWASSILNLGCIGRHLSFSNSTAGSRGKFPLHGIRETLSYISSLAKFALN